VGEAGAARDGGSRHSEAREQIPESRDPGCASHPLLGPLDGTSNCARPGSKTSLSCKSALIGALGLTFQAWAVCSRNLWEVLAVECVILLPNSLSSSYPGAPPGVAEAIHIRAVCMGPLGPFLFSQTAN
jgi:hypothetical protein